MVGKDIFDEHQKRLARLEAKGNFKKNVFGDTALSPGEDSNHAISAFQLTFQSCCVQGQPRRVQAWNQVLTLHEFDKMFYNSRIF